MIEDLAKGELSKEEYPYMREPSAAVLRSMASDSVSVRTSTSNSKPVQSMRTSKPASTWASKLRPSEDGCSRYVNIYVNTNFWTSLIPYVFQRNDIINAMRLSHSDPKITGKRIFVFMVGGATRSEVNMFLLSLKTSFYCAWESCLQIQRFAHDLFSPLSKQLSVCYRYTFHC